MLRSRLSQMRGREATDCRVNSAFKKAWALPEQKISNFEIGSSIILCELCTIL